MGTVITWEILSYFMALIGVKEFSDLGSMVSDQFNLTDPKLLKTEDLAISMSKQPVEDTGGVDLGLNVNSLEYDSENDTYKATKTGSIFAASAPAVVKILLNALGVNVMSTPEVNQKIADALSTAFNIAVTTTDMSLYKIPIIIKDGYTYISQSIAKKLSDALYSNDIFATDSEIKYVTPTLNQWNALYADPNSTTVSYFHALLFNVYSSDQYFGYHRPSGKYVKDYIWENRFRLADAYVSAYSRAVALLAPYGEPQAVMVEISCDDYHEQLELRFRFAHISGSVNNTFDSYVTYGATEGFNAYLANNVTYQHVNCYANYFPSRDEIADESADLYTSSTPIGFNSFNALSQGFRSYYNINSAVIEHGVDGIDKQDGAALPSSSDINIDDVYPNWVDNAIDVGWYDKTTNLLKQGKLLPIDLTDIGDNALTGDFTRTQTRTQTGELDKTKKTTTDTIADEATDTVPFVRDVEDEVVVPADIPDVVPEPTPPVVIPTGTTSAGLATIYNPTEAQVNALKSDLWSQNIITTLQSIFLNNPMDAIISLNKVFCTPHTNGTATIKLGYVQTSVTGVKTVDDQYTTIDCGTVNVPEIYGNTTDYEPYTNVSVFLPFIGIQNLSAKDVVGGKLQIIYRVDVTTGTCIAQLFVTKEGVKQMLYSFEGNCAVEIPLSGSNANRAIIGLASIAASTVAPGAGLALAGGAMNLVNGVNLQRSGGFQSNAGAMNNKKPYLIINRVLPYEASGYNQIYGYPSNNRVLLSSVTGYTRVKDVHVEGISCTDYEKNMIEEHLKAGILL